ncbi:MAG: PD-(D/E)XK nuclease family protein [Candidatus Daviesbacteria bacterium]
MVEKLRSKNLSPTSLQRYQDCPRAYYYSTIPDIPKLTSYPRLCGTVVHAHLNWLYRAHKGDRPFFYQKNEKSIGAFCRQWQIAVEEAITSGALTTPNDKETEDYRGTGIVCIKKYWEKNEFNLPPKEREKRYRLKLPNGIPFVGVLDQIREIPKEKRSDYLKSHRKDLIDENGHLIEGYDPVVIVDLKTDRLSYDIRTFKEDPTLEEEIRGQFDLHEDIQATAYTYLYEKYHQGRKPVGFVWYHLRSGKTFFTYREDKDYKNMFDIVDNFVDNSQNNSFPKRVSHYCRYCDYIRPCREDRDFLISVPEQFTNFQSEEPLLAIGTDVIIEKARQLRFKNFKVPRIKKTPPPITQPSRTIVLKDSPWDQEQETILDVKKEKESRRCGDCGGEMIWNETYKKYFCPAHGFP